MGIKRLSGMDAMLLYSETANLHAHTLKVLVIDAAAGNGHLSFATFAQAIEDKLSVLTPLRYKLVETPWRLHHPVWVEDRGIDLAHHLRRARAVAPGGRRELNELIGRIASTPLDRGRPLWEFHFVEGLAGGRVAIVGKVHHALADGLASANLLSRLMGLSEPDDGSEATSPADATSTPTLLRGACRDQVRQVVGLPALIVDAMQGMSRLRRVTKGREPNPDITTTFDAPPTFLNHEVSPGRTFATASIPLKEVKDIAKRLGATFNDVMLATTTGALRELLLRYDGRADRPLLATIPISTDRSPDRVVGNKISGLTVSLPVHIDQPLRRLALVSAASADAKENHDLLGPTLQGRAMEYLPPLLAPSLFRRQARRSSNKVMNVAVSTVPGPRVCGVICGAPVSEIYSVGILSSGSAMNLTAWSYAGRVGVAVLSDDRTFEDTDEVTDAMLHSFGELRRAAGLGEAVGEAEAVGVTCLADDGKSALLGQVVEGGLH
jgi:diacylglycerol O-acyltransferase / wax synthase